MPSIPLWGRGVKGKSNNVTVQRRLNFYAEQPQEADGGDFVLYGRPGVLKIAQTQAGTAYTAATPASGILSLFYRYTAGSYSDYGEYVRAAFTEGWTWWNTLNTVAFGSAPAGESNPGPAYMEMTTNGNVGFAVNGNTAYYVTISGPAVPLDVAAIPGTFPWANANSCTFLANRFIVNCPQYAGRFAWSILNAVSGSVWSGLDYATAESSPDALVKVFASRGELVLFGTQTIEFWAPDQQTVFAKIQGSTQPWGLLSQFSVQEIGGTVYFLGIGPNGAPQVCAMRGYQVEPISTPDVEVNIAADGIDYPRVTSSAFTIAGHQFFVLNLSKTSWVWDATSQTWCEWQTDGLRWCVQWVITAYGKLVGTDYRNGNVYLIDPDVLSDNGQPIIKEVQTRHTFHDDERFTVGELAIQFEDGTGLTTGQGSNPQGMLQISRDGGHTWGAELWTTIGKIGQYLTRVVWRRLGRGRDFAFRVRIADSVKTVLVRASMRMSK